MEAALENQSEGHKTRKLHLQVEGRYLPMYWMHLAVNASATLETLDQFLRAIWLECCGHLSALILTPSNAPAPTPSPFYSPRHYKKPAVLRERAVA